MQKGEKIDIQKLLKCKKLKKNGNSEIQRKKKKQDNTKKTATELKSEKKDKLIFGYMSFLSLPIVYPTTRAES